MDELVAAAAVVAMATNANAREDTGQRGIHVTVGVGDVEMLNDETMSEDKENNSVHAAGQDPEDAASKVTIALQMLRPEPYTPPLTR